MFAPPSSFIKFGALPRLLAPTTKQTHPLFTTTHCPTEALDIRLRVRGQQHLETVQSIYNLASVYANTGDRKSAQPLFRRAAALYTELLGPTHPDAQDAANKAAKCEKK